MVESQQDQAPSLAEQWSLQVKDVQSNPSESATDATPTSEDDKPADVIPADVITGKDDVVVAEEAPVAEENAGSAEEISETPAAEESEAEEAAEEKPEIKLETAPADFRFPTTNQTRHCFTRYIEYHRCIAAKGEGVPECEKFAKYYRSLCPSEWVERWNEQRENGTFPGPL